MARAVWKVDVNGTPHKIELQWTYWTGDRDVYLDGTKVDDSQVLMRWHSEQKLTIDGEEFEVVTRPQAVNIAAFDVELHWGDRVLKPDIDER